MRKGIHFVRRAALILLLAAMMTAALPSALANTPGVIINPSGSGYVNIRSGPSYDAGILATLDVGMQVEVTGVIGSWYSVWTEGVIGYIESSFVLLNGGTPGTGVSIGATVNNGPLNVREAASMRARIITQLPTYSRVTVTEQLGTWSRIESGQLFGYVVSSFLTLDGTIPPTPTPPVQTPNANAVISTSNGGSLNLRTAASSGAPIMGSYPNGTRVRVITEGTSWSRVQVGDQYGYMSTRFLLMDGKGIGDIWKPSPDPGPITGYNAVVNNPGAGQVLNLREQPSTQSRSLGQYRNGTYLKVLGAGTLWHRVSVDGKTGYMSAQYVRITDGNVTPHKTVTGGANGYVNLRSGPGYDYSVSKRVNNGSSASVKIPYPTWSEVIVREGSGYISGFMLNGFLK